MDDVVPDDRFPQPGALLALDDAKAECRCRICGERVGLDMPSEYYREFDEIDVPVRVTLNCGDEFAHTDCLHGP